MEEYFRIYQVTLSNQERSETDNVYAGEFYPRCDRTNYDMSTAVRIRINQETKRVFKYGRDLRNYVFTACKKIPLARYFNTNPQHGEQFYYQLTVLALFKAVKNFRDLRP